MTTRVLYVDIDGTLVGPRGNLFAGADGSPNTDAAEAIVAARRAGLELVLLTGRHRYSTAELARLAGAAGWIAELGAIRAPALDAEAVLDQGAFPGDGPAVADLRRAGEALVELHRGRLEEHAPWNVLRESSYMVRGNVPVDELVAWLEREGLAWADCVDNGVIPRRYEGLPDVDEVHVFHLVPRGVSKRRALAADRDERGLAPEQCAVIGDSEADLECAAEVGEAFVVANAVAKDPHLAGLVESTANARVTRGSYGTGFAEVVALLT